MSEDYNIVQRPSKKLRLYGKSSLSYTIPIEVIAQSADTGNAVRLYLPLGEYRSANGHRTGPSDRSRVLHSLRNRLRTRGFTLEWSHDPTSKEHVMLWAVRREEG